MAVGLECVMSNRAIRRHHRERLKKRTRKILLSSEFYSIFNPDWLEDLEYRINRRWNNMQMCSCHMCCNPRRGYERDAMTMQEKREYDRYLDDLKELSLDP
jgi:hypothetical protein